MVADERDDNPMPPRPQATLPLVTRVGRRLTRVSKRRPLLAVGAAVAAGVLATSGLSYAAVAHFTGAVQHVDVFGPMTERPEDDVSTNILLVGSDDRAGMSEDDRLALKLGIEDFGRHTDTMMIVHISAAGAVDVISLPRDSVVQVPAFTESDGTTTEAYEGKLNSAYSTGGPTLLVQTIERASGVHLDHYVEVDFSGFIGIVDALGGVEVCTPTPIQDELSGLDLPAGVSTVDGAMGLSYVRARYFDPTADLGRMDRQQQFLGSMFRKATSMGVLMNPLRLSSTVDAVLASLTADEGLDPNQVRTLMRDLQGTSPSQVSFLTMPLTEQGVILDDGGDAVQWDPAAAEAIFAALRTPGSVNEAIRAAVASLPQVSVAPAEVPLSVLNGSGVAGAASKAAQTFTAAGFPVQEVGNGSPTTRTTIVYDPEFDAGLETLKVALPDAKVEAKEGLGEVMEVTIGPDFTSLAPFRTAAPQADAAGAPAPLATTTSAADNPCA
ncbi:MAG: LytR family transcriptional regulator [Actinomycetota bacterium]|nr:LytR family transcriptional regulator [Actinomycetota bacterium]